MSVFGPIGRRATPTVENLRAFMAQDAEKPERKKVTRAVGQSLRRQRIPESLDINRGRPEIDSDAIFDYSEFGEYPDAYLERIRLPVHQRGPGVNLKPALAKGVIPENIDLAREAAARGAWAWYDLSPLRRFRDEYIHPDDHGAVSDLIAMSHPMSVQTPVPVEIQSATVLANMLRRYGGIDVSGFREGAMGGRGGSDVKKIEAARRLLSAGSARANVEGTIIEEGAGGPKVIPYGLAKEQNLYLPAIDRHSLAALRMKEDVHPEDKGGAALILQELAARSGMMPAQFQASQWAGRLARSGRKGYDSTPYVQILDRMVRADAQIKGKDKTQHMIDILTGRDKLDVPGYADGGLTHHPAAKLSSGGNKALIQWLRHMLPAPYKDMPMRELGRITRGGRGGTGRLPIAVGGEHVAKVAQRPRGIRENLLEGEEYLAEDDLIPRKLWSSDLDDAVLVERVLGDRRPIRAWNRPMMMGYANRPHYLRPSEAHRSDEMQELFHRRGMQRFLDYDVLGGDFLPRPEHWGIHPRNRVGPSKNWKGTLLDPGALDRNLLGDVRTEDAENFAQARIERGEFFERLARDANEKRAIQRRINNLRNRVPDQLPGFRTDAERFIGEIDDGIVEILPLRRGVGGPVPSRLMHMAREALKRGPGMVKTIRGTQQIDQVAKQIRNLPPEAKRKLFNEYSEASTRGFPDAELERMLADPEAHKGRLCELYDICAGPIGRRLGIDTHLPGPLDRAREAIKQPALEPHQGMAKGGIVNWLRGVKGSGFDEALDGLRARLRHRAEPDTDADKKTKAIEKWIDTNLANYIVRAENPWGGIVGPERAAEFGEELIAKDIPASHFLGDGVGRRIAYAVERGDLPWLKKMAEADNPRLWSDEQYKKALARITSGADNEVGVEKGSVVDPAARSAEMNRMMRDIEEKYQRRHAPPITVRDIDVSGFRAYIEPELRAALDFLNATIRPGEDLKSRAVPDVIRASRQWHDQIAKKKLAMSAQAQEAFKTREPYKAYPGGWKWMELKQGDEDIAAPLGKQLGHCYADPETCKRYLHEGNLMMLLNPKGELNATAHVKPGMRYSSTMQSFLRDDELPSEIMELSGRQGPGGRKIPFADHRPEALPYVRDLIRNQGPWGDVADLNLAGLIKAGKHFITPEESFPLRRYFWRGHHKNPLPNHQWLTEDEMLNAVREVKMSEPDGGIVNYLRRLPENLMDTGRGETRGAWRYEIPDDWTPPGMASGGRVTPYDEHFTKAHELYPDLPAGLLKAVAARESNFDPRAVSPKGARGIMQFMPQTAKQYGVDVDDPVSSIMGGAKYLAELIKRFGLEGGLAAYNWGSGRVATYGLEKAPAETKQYLNSILAMLGTMPESGVKKALRAGSGDDGVVAKRGEDRKVDRHAIAEEDDADDEVVQYLLAMLGEEDEQTA